MSKITATKDREGAALPIVSPGKSLGKADLLTAAQVFASAATSTSAVYIYCASVIHVSEGQVSDLSAPVDARGGVYLRSNVGAVISVRLVAGEDPATCWIHEVA